MPTRTQTQCPECRATITLDSGLGQPATCPQCFAGFTVPLDATMVVEKGEKAVKVATAEKAASAPALRPKKAKTGKKKKAKAAAAVGGLPKPVKSAALGLLGVGVVLV